MPTPPDNNSIASADIVARSESKDETGKPASLGSYAVGLGLLMEA